MARPVDTAVSITRLSVTLLTNPWVDGWKQVVEDTQMYLVSTLGADFSVPKQL